MPYLRVTLDLDASKADLPEPGVVAASFSPSSVGLLAQSLALIPGIAAPAVVSAATLPLLTRVLSETEFGLYSLAIALLLFGQSLTNGWLVTSIVRYRPAATETLSQSPFERSVYRLVVRWSMLCAIVGMGSLACLALAGLSFPAIYWLIPVQLLPLNLATALAQIERSDFKAGLFNAMNAGRSIGGAIAGFMFVFLWRPTAFAFLLGSTLGWVVVSLVPAARMVGLILRRVPYDQTLMARLLRFGLPLIPSYIFVQVLDVSDRFILGLYFDSAEVGRYAAGYSLASTPYQLLLLLIGAAAAPHIVRLWESHGEAAASSFARRLTCLVGLVGVPIAVSTFTNQAEYRAVLGGGALSDGVVVMPLVSVAGLLLTVQWVAQRGLILRERTTFLLKIYATLGLLNVGANIVLVPRFGMGGAAATTLGCNALLLLWIGLTSRTLRWWPSLRWVCCAAFVGVVGTAVPGWAISLVGPAPSLFAACLRLVVVVLAGIGVMAFSLHVAAPSEYSPLRDFVARRRCLI